MKDNSNKHKEVQQSKGETPSQYTSTSTYKKDSFAAKSKKVQGFNLRIFIPIIAVVAVIGAIVAFTLLPQLEPTPQPQKQYSFVRAWGSNGTENGQFSGAEDIGIDSSGNVYVTDFDNDRIQKFTADGTFITAWGSTGSENGQSIGPNGIAIGSSDNVYVADINDRIQVFAPKV